MPRNEPRGTARPPESVTHSASTASTTSRSPSGLNVKASPTSGSRPSVLRPWLPRFARLPFRLDLDALEALDPAAGAQRRALPAPVPVLQHGLAALHGRDPEEPVRPVGVHVADAHRLLVPPGVVAEALVLPDGLAGLVPVPAPLAHAPEKCLPGNRAR
jgi:hypothetical protein